MFKKVCAKMKSTLRRRGGGRRYYTVPELALIVLVQCILVLGRLSLLCSDDYVRMAQDRDCPNETQMDIIDPLENRINVVLWERKESANGLDLTLYPRSISKPMNILTQLLIFPFQNHVMDILTPLNINGSLPNTSRFNVNIEVVQRAMKRPESGVWENNDHLRLLRHVRLTRAMQTEGKSIFILLFRSHWI